MSFGSYFSDLLGLNEGSWYEGWGVSDQGGGYSGNFWDRSEGDGDWSVAPGEPDAPDYEQALEDAEADAAARTAPIYEEIDRIRGMAEDLPTFTEWMNQQGTTMNDVIGSGAFTNLEDLTARLDAGPTDADYDAGYANAARMMGLNPEEAQMLTGNLSKQLAGYTEGMTEEELAQAGVLDNFSGMSPEEEALRRRQNQSNLRMAEQRAQRLVQDSFADNGSTARMMQTADQATMQINNMQLQQDAALAQEQFERQIAQFDSAKQTWQMMLETNQIGTKQYIDNMQESMGLAVEGYAQQIKALFQENAETMQLNHQDYNHMVGQIEAMYKAAQLELGVSQAELDMMSELYAADIQPYLDEMNRLMAEDEATTTFAEWVVEDVAPIVIEKVVEVLLEAGLQPKPQLQPPNEPEGYMAFSDLRAQGLDLFKNLSNQRSDRRARASQNFIEGARRGLDKVYDSREKDKQREFTAGESQQERDARLAEIDRRGEVQSDLNSEQWEMPRLSYDDQEFFDPKTGIRYTWDTDQEYDLVQQQLRADRAAEQARVEAAFRGDLNDSDREALARGYEFARNELLWNAGNESYNDLTDLPEEELRQRFMDALITGSGLDAIDPQSAESAYRLFKNVMSGFASPEEEEAVEDVDPEGGTGFFNWVPGETTSAFLENNPGLLGQVTAPFVEILSRINPEGAAWLIQGSGDYPDGVNEGGWRNESDVWEQLMSLGSSLEGNDAAMAAGYVETLQEDGYVGRNEMNQIKDFIARATNTGGASTGF